MPAESLERPINRVRNGVQIDGRVETVGGVSVTVFTKDADGYVTRASGATVPTDAAAGYAKGALFVQTDGAVGSSVYVNDGSEASCDFNPSGGPRSVAITAADVPADAAIAAGTTNVVVTSAAATKQVSLPASSADLIGTVILIWVGANGFELTTPASSNATINNVDADGTNQADIAANTLSRLTLVAADKWLLESLTALGAVATAIVPDND